MKTIVKILISGIAVMLTAYLLPGVMVESFTSAIIVAVVITLFNVLFKPLLIILTIPITIFTFGFFCWFGGGLY